MDRLPASSARPLRRFYPARRLRALLLPAERQARTAERDRLRQNARILYYTHLSHPWPDIQETHPYPILAAEPEDLPGEKTLMGRHAHARLGPFLPVPLLTVDSWPPSVLSNITDCQRIQVNRDGRIITTTRLLQDKSGAYQVRSGDRFITRDALESLSTDLPGYRQAASTSRLQRLRSWLYRHLKPVRPERQTPSSDLK